MDKQPKFSDNKNQDYHPPNFKPQPGFKPTSQRPNSRHYNFDQGFKLLKPYPFQQPLPNFDSFITRPIGSTNPLFIQSILDSARPVPNPRLQFHEDKAFTQNQRQTLFVQNPVSMRPPDRAEPEVNSGAREQQIQGKDIQIKHLKVFSEESCEDLDSNVNLETLQAKSLHHDMDSQARCREPWIKIISPHLKQYFKKNARLLENKHFKDTEINLRSDKDGGVLIKTKLESQPKISSKLSFSKKIKKSGTGRSRQESQRNFWTINQHINIQNISAPTGAPFYGAERSKRCFPIHDPAKDYLHFNEMFKASRHSPRGASPGQLDSENVQSNWDLICQMNLEDKLYLDVSTNNIYLKIDNKNDQRFKHFESIHQYSTELEDIRSQLVPVSESLLPNHLLKLKKSKGSRAENDAAWAEPCPKENLTEKLKKSQTQQKQAEAKPIAREKKTYSTAYRKRTQQGCKCSKSKCLRLHCICFKQGKYCDALCGCNDCYNSEAYSGLVEKVKSATKDINSRAFESKFLEIERDGEKIKITKGCTCMKNNCLKNYCECRKNRLACTTLCKCDQCFNDYIKLTPEEVAKMHTKNSRKKKKIIFQTKNNKTIDFESKEIVSCSKKHK